MTSLFRARRRSPEDEARSGGKILRGRRAAPSASPYQMPPPPPPPPLPPADAQHRNPSWLSGLISGAGKLISSVFGTDGISPSASSSDYSSDEDIISTSNEDEDIDASAKELHELNKGGQKQVLIRDHVEASSAIVPKSESKLAIEQMLMQETFSRDECKKLTEILQSRVVDYPSAEVGENGTQKEIPNNTSGSAISFLGGYRQLNRHSELQDTIPHSSNILNALSPGFSVLQARTHDLRTTAVMEAKKWLEEKKLASSSNTNLDCGPCTLNTDMLHDGIEGEVGSPVDMAKSYMRSLPPWQSSSLCSIGFKTPPPSGTYLYKDETYATTSHSLPSSKLLKRNYLAIGPWDTLDEIRRVRMKSTDNLLEISNYKQSDSFSSLLDHRTSKISPAAEKRELPAEDHCTNGALSLPDEKAIEVNHSTKTDNVTSVSIISNLEEALNAGQLTNVNAMPITSVPSYSEIGSETKLSDPDVHIFDENHDVEKPSQTKEQVDSFALPIESLVLASTPVEHDGDPLSEAKIVLPEEIKSAASSDADVANHKVVDFPTVQVSSGAGERLQANKSSQLTILEERHPISDSRYQDGDVQVQKEAKGFRDKIAANGAPAEYNTNSNLESLSKGDPSPTSSNTDEPKGTSELLSESAIDIPVNGTNARTGKLPNGTRMKSIERMLTETQSGTRRRGRKAVVRSKRGRGRVK